MNTRKNPYVGPIPFGREHTLPARDREVWELRMRLRAERLVLLHSPSGAGKTSLIEAGNGLRTALEKNRFRVLPSMRINRPIDGETETGNRYVLSVLKYLSETAVETQELKTFLDSDTRFLDAKGQPVQPPADRWPDLYDEAPSMDFVPQREVLIFDQFEELLTTDPTDDAGRHAFLTALGEVLEARHRYALFVIREDFLGALEPWFKRLPTHLAARYRLELLNEAGARDAVVKPAKAEGVTFEPEALTLLVDDLRCTHVQKPDGSLEERAGQYVEAVQLQVVCRRLWERLPDSVTVVNKAELDAVGSADDALQGFYDDQLLHLSQRLSVKERRIRDWFEHQLLTAQGLRNQVLLEARESGGLPNAVIRELERVHIVRAEARRGVTFFELSHDRLVAPVRASNKRWRQENLQPFQFQALVWQEKDRSASLLFQDDALAAAEAYVKNSDEALTTIEHDFIQECRREQKEKQQQLSERQVAQERRQNRFAVTVLTFFLSLVSVAAVVAFQQRGEAKAAQEMAEAQRAKAEKAQSEAQLNAVAAEAARDQAASAAKKEAAAASMALAALREADIARKEAVKDRSRAIQSADEAKRQQRAAEEASKAAAVATIGARISLSFAEFERLKDLSPNDAAMALLIAANAPPERLTDRDMQRLEQALRQLKTRPLLIGQMARPGEDCHGHSQACFEAIPGNGLSCERVAAIWSKAVIQLPLLKITQPKLDLARCVDTAYPAFWGDRREGQANRIPVLKLWAALNIEPQSPKVWVDAEGTIGRTASTQESFAESEPKPMFTTDPVVVATYSPTSNGSRAFNGKLLLLHRNGQLRLFTLKDENGRLRRTNEQFLTLPHYDTRVPTGEKQVQTQHIVLLPGGDYALTLDREGIVRVWDLTATEQYAPDNSAAFDSGTDAARALSVLKKELQCIQPYRPSKEALTTVFSFSLNDNSDPSKQDQASAEKIHADCPESR